MPDDCESKHTEPKLIRILVRYPRLAWYIAAISTLNTILLVFHPFG